MRIGFLLRHRDDELLGFADRLGRLIADCPGDHTAKVVEDDFTLPGSAKTDVAVVASDLDALIVLGGDGTFLRGARIAADSGIPILGINLGNLGFMTQYHRDMAQDAVRDLCQGALRVVERMRLSVRLIAPDGQAMAPDYALNEAVLGQQSIARLVHLAASLDGEPVTTYSADGLIVSTPTGSTAYNLAAGGPIMTPGLQAFVLTPICPHALTNRPLVVPGHSVLRLRNAGDTPLALTLDGQIGKSVACDVEVELKRAETPLRMFSAPAASSRFCGKSSTGANACAK